MKAKFVLIGIVLLIISLILTLLLVFLAQVELILVSLLTNFVLLFYTFQIVWLVPIACTVVGCSFVFLGIFTSNILKKKEPGTKIEEKNIWTAKREKPIKEVIDEKDFEETRRCLLNSYHSYVQTHAGYIIALIIGLFAVIVTFHDFINYVFWGIFAFIVLILAIIVASAYMALRIVYRTKYANVAISLPIDTALEEFDLINRRNKERKNKYGYYDSKAPNTAIIENAITIEMEKIFESFIWYEKIALRRFRPKTTTEKSSNTKSYQCTLNS